jgi:hypothetical protein
MGACEWPVSYAECGAQGGGIPEPLLSMPASGRAIYEDMATDYLWNWTGKALGTCEVTVQPCRTDCRDGVNTFTGGGPGGFNAPWTPVLVQGTWMNITCGRCGDRCGCGGATLRLPGPIVSVEGVSEDGEALSTDAYHVEGRRVLVRDDGKPWPACGLEVTYTRGTPVPVGGQVAAGVLAMELALAACASDKCRLPKRVQTVTRQGVTIAMLDAFDDVDKGHTGIWIVDSWIASVTRSPVQARVLSPDKPRSPVRRRTWN